MGRSSNIFSV